MLTGFEHFLYAEIMYFTCITYFNPPILTSSTELDQEENLQVEIFYYFVLDHDRNKIFKFAGPNPS